MDDIQVPLISKGLVDWLSELHPNRCPNPSESDREIWIEVGRQDVIRKLRTEYENQSILPTETL